jgi:hypothetical protein
MKIVVLLLAVLGPDAPVAHVVSPADTAFVPQGVHYRIEAILDEQAQVLSGRARLRYTNHAAARLDTLYVHQYLNAFRPNSAWARREARFGELRFQRLRPGEHAYERFTRVLVAGEPVTPHYPGAPDSTVAAIPLPRPLEPGASVIVDMDWEARTSLLPRRQGRRGRHWDLAQWYPRIAVFDRAGWQHHALLPQGEFYGEFADYDVTLQVAADQVLGATGVPVAGDPGWAAAAADGYPPAGFASSAYADRPEESLGLLATSAPPGYRRVRWRAENVHHFAWSASPRFIYEGGEHRGTLVHVLYQPGDTSWDRGVALARTKRALDWLEHTFGPYPWPQLTNLHRIEGGGTEFPMLMMNGSASQGLIVHEAAHQYAHGILANNEWLESWLDEGLASFVTSWYWERVEGIDTIWLRLTGPVEQRERLGATQPIATPAAEFVDFATFGAMTYSKAALVFRMLREHVGEETFLRILRTYYDRFRFRHVRGADFERVAAEVAGEDLAWFFDQWLRTTQRLDYGIADAVTRPGADGGWHTTVEVFRRGEAWMPVVLRIGSEVVRLTGRERLQRIEVRTADRPQRAVLDPDHVLIDYDRSNNARMIRE